MQPLTKQVLDKWTWETPNIVTYRTYAAMRQVTWQRVCVRNHYTSYHPESQSQTMEAVFLNGEKLGCEWGREHNSCYRNFGPPVKTVVLVGCFIWPQDPFELSLYQWLRDTFPSSVPERTPG